MEEEGGWEGGDGRGAVKRGEGAGGGEGGGGGDLPRTVCTPALLSHLSPSTISLWLAELIMEKCGGGGGGGGGNGTLETHLRLPVKFR